MKSTISIQALSKCYMIAEKRPDAASTFREMLVESGRKATRRLQSVLRGEAIHDAKPREFWALNGVDLEIEQGTILGVVGQNGAGKSTLLKILSRITEPTGGRIIVRGRVASLLEVGTGFHPEMTGRENVFLNAAILGMRRSEVLRRFDSIVAFADVDEFIDTPVKRYSSGMYMRLAFSVAAHVETDILLVDEVLAVGDMEFQKKCLAKMDSIAKTGNRTVVFVSHQMSAVSSLCSHAIRLSAGKIVDSGPPNSVVSAYIADTTKTVDSVEYERAASKEAAITRISVDRASLARGDLCVDIAFQAERAFVPHPGLVISSPLGAPLFGSNTRFHPDGYDMQPARCGTLRLTVRDLPLVSDIYLLSVYLGDAVHDLDAKEHALRFFLPTRMAHTRRPGSNAIGYINLPAQWLRVRDIGGTA